MEMRCQQRCNNRWSCVALEELEMLKQTDVGYEARRKAQLDYNTGLKVARPERREEGERIGTIHLCERLLNRPETPTDELAALSLEGAKPSG
jgi:hypothetical protein